MKFFIEKHHRILFYFSWLLLGLFQAAFTELQDDEAYYWVYSKYPAWGYFDHPPMIALMVKAGYAIFRNELGIRLAALLMNLFSLLIIEKLIINKNSGDPAKQHLLFYAIVLSLSVLQLSGFIAAPDIPLIFFTSLFFLCYRIFLRNSSFFNSVLLGGVIALLFYSKYHGLLIVFFVLISNIKLFTRYQIYVAGMVALICFLPHLVWQWKHDFVSLQYHLSESNVNPYKISYSLEYILGQFLLAGPIAGFILVPAAIMRRPHDLFERALHFTLIGIYVFFLVSSFRGKVEANWTSPGIVPLIILSHRFLTEKNKWRNALFKTLPVTILLVLVCRVIMVLDIMPLKQIRQRYHAWKKWPLQMKEITKKLPVVFNNSYQRASKYWFYSGQMTYSQNYYRERRNNYNFWPVEDSLLGKSVYILDIHNMDQFPDTLKTPIGWVGFKFDPSFSSLAKVTIECDQNRIKIKQGELFTLNCVAKVPPHYRDYISGHPGLKTLIKLGVFNKAGWIKDLPVPLDIKEISHKSFELKYNSPISKGIYYLRFSITAGGTLPTHNSDKIRLVVE